MKSDARFPSQSSQPDPLLAALVRLQGRGYRIIRAGLVADELWPQARHHNTNGQVFNLSAGVAGRMLRKSRLVREIGNREWEIIQERLEVFCSESGEG